VFDKLALCCGEAVISDDRSSAHLLIVVGQSTGHRDLDAEGIIMRHARDEVVPPFPVAPGQLRVLSHCDTLTNHLDWEWGWCSNNI
jgi:hypothetical protein